ARSGPSEGRCYAAGDGGVLPPVGFCSFGPRWTRVCASPIEPPPARRAGQQEHVMTDLSFRAAGVSERIVGVLRRRGIVEPFRIQTLVLPPALAGRDVLAKSPTGSGKTLAFAIPLAERLDPNSPTPAALVLVPTRELAQQVTDELAPLAHARGLRVAEVYGGVGLDLQARPAPGAHLVVATPGRPHA